MLLDLAIDATNVSTAATQECNPETEGGAVLLENIPAELQERPHWVLWRYETRDGEPTKVPYSPHGGRAKANDPATWGTFEQAVEAYRARPDHWSGIGYEFSSDDPYCGVDLDSILDPTTGEFLGWPESFVQKCDAKGSVPAPRQIVEALCSYCEVSPSGTGVKMLLRGKIPPGGHRRDADDKDARNGKTPGVEMYDSGRYFTVTGRRVPTSPPTIAEANGVLSHLHWLIFGKKAEVPAKPQKAKGKKKKRQAATPENLDDAKIIKLASEAENGAKFTQLWNGDISGYGSDSEADLALANMLAFFCGADSHDRVEVLMRQSGLYREKWDKHPDYLRNLTIAKAFEGRTEFYKQQRDPASVEKALAKLRQIANGVDVGEGEKVYFTIAQILKHISEKTEGWPRRVGQDLFVHDPQHGVCFLPRVPSLFGWLANKTGGVTWFNGASAVNQSEVFAELRRTSQQYRSVEELPHEPPMQGHYYACEAIQPGDGKAMGGLLDRFCPATDADRQLILSAFLTPLWGGPCGCRPCFVITSDDGCGVGKSTVAQMVGQVFGGVLEFEQMTDIGVIKTRLLSPNALTKRVAFLDNLKSHNFSWGELEGLITASDISGRALYVGESSRPNGLTWFITLNGACLSTDMAQRSILVKVRKPDRSGTWFDETKQYISDHRTEIIGDLIGVLRRPQAELRRFSRWASWEREILQRLPEPNELQQIILERQKISDVNAEEAEIIEDFFAGQLRRLDYDPESEKVFISSQIAAKWFKLATGSKSGVVATCRQLTQMVKEEKLPHIVIPGKSWGRGFCYVGERWNLTHISVDLIDRLRDKNKAEGREDSPLF
jgi:primase-polymerase (primpol)-like protein